MTDPMQLDEAGRRFRQMSERESVSFSELQDAVTHLFTAAGLSAGDAELATQVVLYPQLCGLDSHGVGTMPLYITGLLDRTIKPRPQVKTEHRKACTLLIDADNGLGLSESKRAMDAVIALARTHGLGAAAVRNSSHFGSAGYYADLAARQGLIGLAFSNAAPAIAPTGGVTQLLGTNPIGAGAPLSGEPMVLDMATAAVARSRIRQMLSAGQNTIPEGWALDGEGNPTTDAAAAIAGSVLPIGGAKGYGLALLVELLCSALSDGKAGFGITYENVVKRPSGIGHFFLAIDPEGFAGLDAFTARADHIAETIETSRGREGVSPRLPGRRGQQVKADRLAHGVPIVPTLKAAMAQTAGIIEKHLAGTAGP